MIRCVLRVSLVMEILRTKRSPLPLTFYLLLFTAYQQPTTSYQLLKVIPTLRLQRHHIFTFSNHHILLCIRMNVPDK